MTMSEVKEATRAARDIAVDVSRDLPQSLQSADVWIRDAAARQPLVALGVALAAGYAVGRMLARR